MPNPEPHLKHHASAMTDDAGLALSKRQLAGLTTLLSLEKEARHAPDLQALGFISVNESLRLLHYEQAIFWRRLAVSPLSVSHLFSKQANGTTDANGTGRPLTITIVSFSGITRFDPHAPHVVWLHNLIGQQTGLATSRKCHNLSVEQVDHSQRNAWLEWSPPHVLWVPLAEPCSGELLGGLWLARDLVWEAGEQRLAEHMADGYGQALALLLTKSKRNFISLAIPRIVRLALLGCLLVGLLLLPVQQSVLAPATVVAEQPTIMSAPADGVVQLFHVVPNQTVVVGQALFELDPTEVNHQLQVATEEMAVALAHYQKAESKAFQTPESGGELASLRALMARAATQAQHAKQLLQRLQVSAPVAGVVLFSDVNEWLGRPVRVGERILAIADPTNIEMEILLPVADALVFKPGTETRMFLHINPLNPLPGKLRYASYEASATPEGLLAYHLRSVFLDKDNMLGNQNGPRLGLKGTAKLFGEKVPLFIYLFRRPFSALRQRTGW